MPRLRNLGLGSPEAYSVMATATDYLPEAIGAYTRLPRQWADSRPIENGKTSLMLLIDQLDLLSATMDKIFDAVVRVDADALDRAWPLPAGEVRSCLNRRSAEHRRPARAGSTAQHLGPAVTEPSTRTLAAALDELRSAAVAAGLEPEAAVREGEALAAAVAESAEQAYRDWCDQTGHQDPQAFFDAAHRGRRWRAAPTALLGQLVVNRSPHAASYAEALGRGLPRRRRPSAHRTRGPPATQLSPPQRSSAR